MLSSKGNVPQQANKINDEFPSQSEIETTIPTLREGENRNWVDQNE